jgi:aromatic-L-amino-acid decarboxylase
VSAPVGDDPGEDALDRAQRGLGDMEPAAFRRHGADVVGWIADYLDTVGARPVRSPARPGEVRAAIPSRVPEEPVAFDAILADLDEVVLPGITHWNHPAFHAYFAITGSGPGILGEAVAAALNVNGMLWRTSPAATELEEAVVDWVGQLLGLPAGNRGVLCDTASMATMLALAAARHRSDPEVRQRGLAGRTDVPLLRVYASEQAHSSVQKAAIALGLGLDGVRSIPTDDRFRLDVEVLREAVREDVRFGYRPLAIVPTVGTTSTTSIDPVRDVVALRDSLTHELGVPLWVHVDAAYGGMIGVLPERRGELAGLADADSVVTNPHKWLFTPIDCSVLLIRDPHALTDAFSLVPEYLTTDDEGVTDFMDWGVQLGRRFRALKLWMVLRYFGRRGIEARLRHQLAQAASVVRWVEEHPNVELAAPAPMTTVCFRSSFPGDDAERARARDRRWLEAVNRTGAAYLSHTELDGRFALRLAIGNLRTTDERLAATLEVLGRELGAARAATDGPG